MIPVFLALVAIVVAASLRDRQVVRRGLEPEVSSGVLSAEDLAMLSSPGNRRRALRAAKAHGPAVRRALEERQHTAIELAFLRRHSGRRDGEEGRRLTELERAYVERLRAGRGDGSSGPGRVRPSCGVAGRRDGGS